MANFAGGKIEAYVGPKELGAADALETVIVDFIAAAKESLDLDCSEIPDSAKPVRIIGADPYRLDTDVDGLGCEPGG